LNIKERSMKAGYFFASGLLLASLGLARGMAYAQEPGWYAGAGIGRSTFNVHLDHLLGGSSPGSIGLKENRHDAGWKFLSGYRFDGRFGMEVEYANLGDYALSDPAGVLGTPGGRIDGGISSFTASITGRLPINDKWSATGRIGVSRLVVDVDATSVSRGKVYGKDHASLAPVLAAGADYKLDSAWSLRAEYAYFGKPRVFHDAGERVRANISLLSFNILYSF